MTAFIKSITISDILRLLIGAVFIFAAIPKISDPLDFAFNLAGYQLFPQSVLPYMAIFVPYLELVTGVFLISGLFLRGALTISAGMMVVFIISLVYALIQGVDINCGCFGQEPGIKSNLWLRIFEDIVYGAGLVYIYFETKIKN